MAVRERFDRRNPTAREYVTMRAFTYGGRDLEKGDAFPTEGVDRNKLAALHGSRYIDLVPRDAAAEGESTKDGVALTETSPGRYEITAAWLDAPEKVRGKTAAEARAAELRAEGPPLGFIEGGTEVTVEAGEGGWYTVDAPWLEEPRKAQGREAADALQREIHEAGEPELHHGVLLREAGNGWFDVKANWEAETTKVQGREAAVARATELRQAGPPGTGNEGAGPKVGDRVTVAGEGEPVEGVVTKIDGETATLRVGGGEEAKDLDAPLAALTVVPASTEEKAEGGEQTPGSDAPPPPPPPPPAATE